MSECVLNIRECVEKVADDALEKKYIERIAELEAQIVNRNKEIIEKNKRMIELIEELEKEKANKIDNGSKINLNDRIKVKLTPLGAEIYYHQYDEINKKTGRTVIEPHMPRIDKDGYTDFALWAFIEMYGEHIGVGKRNVIEPIDIFITQ